MSEHGCVQFRGPSRWARVAAMVVGTLGMAACDEKAPTAPGPTPVAVAGRWSGSMSDQTAGIARLEVEVTGYGDLATGTFALRLDDGARVSGLVIGRTNEHPTVALTFFISEASRDCSGAPGFAYRARLVLVENRLTGTYAPDIGCPVLSSGAIELTRS